MDPPANTYYDEDADDGDADESMEVVADAEMDDDDDDDDEDDDDEEEAEAVQVAKPEPIMAAEHDDDDDEEDAEEPTEVMASVVVDEADDDDDEDDDDNEEEEDVAVASQAAHAVVVPAVVEAAPVVSAVSVVSPVVASSSTAASALKAKAKTPSKKKKKAPSKKSSKSSTVAPASHAKSDSKGASKKKKRKKTSSSHSNTTTKKHSHEESRWTRIAPARLDAAAQARRLLVEAVPTLPHVSGDIHVRSLGRLPIESSADRSSKFSKANALYPVGYSCDRYEFSPVHGRILKMRCSILDGRTIVAKQVQMGVANPRTDLPDGPVFRIMWGQGIEEDVEQVEYPYDPYAMSPPLSSDEVDAVAIPTTPHHHHGGGGKSKPAILPRVGMRVKAVFENNHVFQGTISRVAKPDDATSSTSSKKKKRKKTSIEILYDDGSIEVANFPDPEITLMSPGKKRTGLLLESCSVCRVDCGLLSFRD